MATHKNSNCKAIRSKVGFPSVKMLLEDDPGWNIPYKRLPGAISSDQQGPPGCRWLGGCNQSTSFTTVTHVTKDSRDEVGLAEKPVIFSCPGHGKSIRGFTARVDILATKT